MELLKGIFILIFMLGIIMLVTYFVIKSELKNKCDDKIIYKYMLSIRKFIRLFPI